MTTVQHSRAEQTYRLQVTTLAVDWSEGKGRPLYIPAGALLMRPRAPESRSPLIEISWNGRSLQMFAEDFDSRTQPADSVS